MNFAALKSKASSFVANAKDNVTLRGTGLVAAALTATVAYVAVSAVVTAKLSDVGHDIIELF